MRLHLAVIACVAVVFSGCTAQQIATPTPTPTPSPQQSSSSPSSSPSLSADISMPPYTPSHPPTTRHPSAPSTETGEPARFQDTVVWPDGLTMRTSRIWAFAPSDEASGGIYHPHAVAVRITLTNRTGKPFTPAFSTKIAQSDGEYAVSILDRARGILPPPTGAIPNGGETSFLLGFGVNDPHDLSAVFALGSDQRRVFFRTDF
jgi:hypothetical protein